VREIAVLLPMAKIHIIGSKRKLEATLRVLHRLGTLQIEDVTEHGPAPVLPRMTLDKAAHAQREEIGLLVTRLESLAALFSHPPEAGDLARSYEAASLRSTEDLVTEAKHLLGEAGPKAQSLALKRDELDSERVSLTRYQATLQRVLPLAAELPELAGYETAALLIERRSSGVLDLIRERLASLTGDHFELNAQHVDQETTAAVVVFPRERSAAVNALFGRENISQLRLPKELAGVSFKDALATMAARLAEIPAQIERVNEELRRLGEAESPSVALLRAVLGDRLREMEITGLLGATRYTFVLVGWTARRDLAGIREALAREIGPQVLVGELAVGRDEMRQAPVALANLRPVRPFEFLVALLALPRYGAIDPTPLLALFMPIFFGLILGDIAYAVALLLLAAWMLRVCRKAIFRSLAQVMLLCGFWSALFGVLFGELLGGFGHRVLHLKPLWMERSGETIMSLLVFAVAVGVAHVMLGLVLGIWEAVRMRSGKELSERAGKFIALIALFWLLAVVAGRLPRDLSTPGIVALIIGIALLSAPMGLLGGILGPIEALGALGNVLSYLRLAAIGLASFYLAEVANRLYGVATNVAVGAIVAGLLHALNLAIGIVSSTIQSLRLHYVEFFTKFYEGGGRPFRPFKQSGV
jgi:V/A-type H+/Na+-transporting ATPase subunit I